MSFPIQRPKSIYNAYNRIKDHVRHTPILESTYLNQIYKNKIFFKIDALQTTGSFKIRGVFNHLLICKERNQLAKKIVSYSTGNHAIALSYAGRLLNIHVRVYLPKEASRVKKSLAEFYGAEIVEVENRQIAEELAEKDKSLGYYYLSPSDDDDIIAGAGTLCYEGIKQIKALGLNTDVVFASCGGGSLLSGSYLAKELCSSSTKLHGVEPQIANDAYLSFKNGSLFRFDKSPDTIADGLRALSVSQRTLQYLYKLDDFHLIDEKTIKYWATWFMSEMKIKCEYSSSISIGAACKWIKQNSVKNKVLLILITGGNR